MRLGIAARTLLLKQKQARLWNLREISLAAREVGWLGREVPGWIKALCPAVVDMDLSRNLFSRWCEVAYVCVELPALEMLRLNHNHFWWWLGGRAVNFPPYFDPCASIPTGSFTNIKVLALNNTGIPWSEIETVVAPNFPNLQELHLGFNAMESFGPLQPSSTSLFSNLLLLNLESNLLSSWSDISTIASRLPSLTNLHLPNNKLFSIPASVTPLPTLKTLNVSQNAISDWLSLHAFNTHLPNLKELRFKGNPITATIEKNQARLDLLFEITARVGSITSVNGSPISPKDRRDAELWYLGKCAMEKLNSSIPFDATHPRYPALVLVHGESAAAPASAVSTALKDRLLELTLVSVMARNVPVCKKVTKKVPMTMTVRALKSLMARLVVPKGFGGECVFVEALVKGDDGWRNEDGMVRGDGGWLRPIVMGDELRDLGFYDLRSGDGVRMVLVD
ncbi:hypothetical protein BC829DRAFT_408316 [Chytridium lagenaria]|nr:hypothetical protein BC829DRAFT_408316 [Chytridium lagenaria]